MDASARADFVGFRRREAAALIAARPSAPQDVQPFFGVPILTGEANLAFSRFANGQMQEMPPLRANARLGIPAPNPGIPAAPMASDFGDPGDDQENAQVNQQ
ncbi:MAG: hypothetical protein LQ352_004678 [Teloschistes flavicans]|nr:MAG: hypothetical protein LQ352_004678 [Teloschistes flavicans]